MTSSKPPRRPIHGWINLYKPYGMGSTEAVTAVKRLLRPEKIGHAGTLDPLAEGVLPLALGEATKTVPYLMDARKIYQFTLTFGESRTTDDAEGEVVAISDHRPTQAEIEAVLPQFTGSISQIPPIYSAIKVDGQRAYDLARAGHIPEMKARQVMIYELMMAAASAAKQSIKQEQATFRATCSKGTYIRSLARDIAAKLGTLGYVSTLKREGVGAFLANGAISLDFLEEIVHNPTSSGDLSLEGVVQPLSLALDDIPAFAIDNVQASQLRHGQAIASVHPIIGGVAAAFSGGQLVAVCERQNELWKPKRVFNL
jgi:tRNA pseudouridine55 synthase